MGRGVDDVNRPAGLVVAVDQVRGGKFVLRVIGRGPLPGHAFGHGIAASAGLGCQVERDFAQDEVAIVGPARPPPRQTVVDERFEPHAANRLDRRGAVTVYVSTSARSPVGSTE